MPSTTTPVAPKNTHSWYAPASRPEDINALILGVDRYNPHNLPLLEDYLDVQIKDGAPDLFSNLAILKLYQFNPTQSNPKILIDILLLSLASPSGLVDAADFGLAQGLALDRLGAGILKARREYDEEENPDVDEVETVLPFLRNCWALLRECRFREFWKVFGEDKSEGAELIRSHYLPNHVHMTSLLRLLMSTTISSSFSSIHLSRLQKFLNFSSVDEAREYVQRLNGWKVDGDVVRIEGNGDNDVKAGVVREQVELNQLTKLVAAAAN